MYKWEEKIVLFINKHILFIAAILVTVLAFMVRKPMMETMSSDYLANLIEVEGNFHTTFYMFCMNILALFDQKPLFFLVKLTCMALDILAAASVALLVHELTDTRKTKAGQTDAGLFALIAYTAYLMLPATLMNSAYWAHLDSGSIFLLVAAVLMIRRQKYIPAAVLAAIGCSLLSYYLLFLGIAGVITIFRKGTKGQGTAVQIEREAVVQKEQKTAAQEDIGIVAKRVNTKVCLVSIAIFVFTLFILSLSGLALGYSFRTCIGRLNFFYGAGSWYFYPVVIMLLVASFRDKYFMISLTLLQVTVILDWGQFLYEQPVLPYYISYWGYALTLVSMVIAAINTLRERKLKGKIL